MKRLKPGTPVWFPDICLECGHMVGWVAGVVVDDFGNSPIPQKRWIEVSGEISNSSDVFERGAIRLRRSDEEPKR